MELYVLDNNDLSTLSILECSDYEINLDNQFTDKSTFRVNKAPGQIKDNFLVVNGLYQQFLFIIDEVEATDKEEKFVNLVCSDISNIFNRKIIEQDTNLMTTRSIEYFLAHMMDVNFVNSDDSVLNKSYINITYTEHTQAKVQTNAENGIYNFHTFMENCREYQNVYVDFSIENGYLNITIKYKNDTPVTIDTTIPEITHYNKVYEQDITAKVTVYVRETNEIFNWYLKTDRTVTTNKNDPNRAAGAIEVISVDTLDVAEQEALNVFKGNTYKHLVEFSMSKNSKLVDTTKLYIGRAIIIKTPDGIYESIISGISLHDDNFINFKSGNIRITFIDKLKQEQENYGNKLDVTGGTIKGNLTTTGNQTTNGTQTINGTLNSGNANGSTAFYLKGGSDSQIHWKEYGYGDKFRIIPEFGGVDDSNKLKIQGAVGGAGTDPSFYDLMTITGKTGHLWTKGNIESGAGDVAFIHKHPTSGVQCRFGIGSGGTNRGYYDDTAGKWMIYYDGSTLNLNNGTYVVGNMATSEYLKLPKDKAIQFSNTNILRVNSSNNTVLSGPGATMYFRPNGDTAATNEMTYDTNGNLICPVMKATNGFWSRDQGTVGTASGTGRLVIKRAVNTEAPNNGVVLEYGNSTNWTGQLFIGDNATQGIYYNGWSNGTRGSWRRLGESAVDLYNNTSGTTGTVTLSQTSANFKYIEIFYGKNNAELSHSAKIAIGTTTGASLISGYGTSNNFFQLQLRVVNISGTSITNNSGYNNGGVNCGSTPYINPYTSVETRIYKVVGYYS